ncbi:MAG: hypothetical protein ABR95_12620 [Sphingobacteriales bacterium BACL12 MAG-120813-bin55]|nr:MAG: hypothetical protein ABR94_02530 [Sphingobacteriales bacterium BACL12 MAG-120802-bin5]KRP13911.1 MAG: hypothetical protein ABR95_12620 [Sphingobacteriales bacterium BACL12 MAG-120813-bin55]
MHRHDSNTAILIFARNPEDEVRSKQWKERFNYKLASGLWQHARKVAAQSGLPVILHTTAHQEGPTFGLRLQRALQLAFDQGYENVIAIGSDCPQLKSHHLRKAAAMLEYHDVVGGPDYRGGVYLLGLSRAAFTQTDIAALPWQSAGLFAAIENSTPDRRATLPRLHDINSLADTFKLLRLPIRSHQLQWLQQVLSLMLLPGLWQPQPVALLSGFHPGSPEHRGPPHI